MKPLRLMDLLYPKKCVFCKSVIPPDRDYCTQCASHVRYLADHFFLDTDPVGLFVQQADAAIYYNNVTGRAIKALKFHTRTATVEALTRMLCRRYDEVFVSGMVDVILPVPLHKNRLRQRGYNQSELLAKELSRHTGIPMSPHLLERARDTKPQSSLSGRTERIGNLKDAFTCPQPQLIQGRRILLIDDVCTTGSTLVECAHELHRCGAKCVMALTVMRTEK